MLNFVSKASGLSLQPIIDEVLVQRARKAMGEVEVEGAQEEGLEFNEVSEYLDPTKTLSNLTTDSLFLADKPVPTNVNLFIPDIPRPVRVTSL